LHIGDDYYSIGINGKNSEFHAAMGLAIFPHINEIIEKRKIISNLYDTLFASLPLTKPIIRENAEYNFAYYPIIFNTEQELLKVKNLLFKNEIVTRRYFFPSLNRLPYVTGQDCPVSEDISKRVLCLPLYPDLPLQEVERIVALVKHVL
jgi:dTDP-4-amino-4,6-dideoxygalactose transaminase